MNKHDRHEHLCPRCRVVRTCGAPWCPPIMYDRTCSACESLDRARSRAMAVDALADLQALTEKPKTRPTRAP